MRRLSLLLVIAAACAKPAPRFPNAPVILISIDTLRSDHLPAYGYRAVQTPNIDALRRDSILFSHAYAQCPMTLPSHLSMLTGLLPFQHGVRDNTGFRFDASQHLSLPALLRTHGYRSGAAVSSFVLRRETGIADAFDFYDDAIDVSPNARFTDYQRSGVETEAIAERWIAGQGASPFFFMLHLYEPHAPYVPSYDGEIARADAIVGTFIRFLRAKGIYDRAVIILTSDHGEGLGDHGEQQHSILVYREAIQVPLLVKLPAGQSANTTNDSTAQSIDLLPTIASLLNVNVNAPLNGKPLLDPRLERARTVYAESLYGRFHFGWSSLRSVTDGRTHLIQSKNEAELYDLIKDPGERDDVKDSRRADLASMRDQLSTFAVTDAVPSPVDPEEAAKLAALGYVGSVRARAEGEINPRAGIGIVEEIREANGDVAKLRRLAESNPKASEIWLELGNALLAQGQSLDAINAYQRAGPGTDAILGLAQAAFAAGDYAQCERAAMLTMKTAPREANLLLAKAALARGDLRSADTHAKAAIGGNPPLPSDLVLLADIAARSGAFGEALALLDRVQHVERADAIRADILARTGHPDDAIKTYERAVTDFPHDLRAWANLAVLYYAVGDRRMSDRTLDRMLKANPTMPARELAAKTRATLKAG